MGMLDSEAYMSMHHKCRKLAIIIILGLLL